jgi:hypothetical protein
MNSDCEEILAMNDTDTEQKGIKELCTEIANEQDPQKMMQLADELDMLLEKKLERLRMNRVVLREK